MRERKKTSIRKTMLLCLFQFNSLINIHRLKELRDNEEAKQKEDNNNNKNMGNYHKFQGAELIRKATKNEER